MDRSFEFTSVCNVEEEEMQIARYLDRNDQPRVGIVADGVLTPLDPLLTLTAILSSDTPSATVENAATDDPIDLSKLELLPPIEQQEVWAAGVTYKRSQTARMEESEAAASCYDRIYESPRPEIFFKATPHRVRGNGQDLFIREDSAWNVPEPEITLVLSEHLKLVGFTIGNDMSSRDIEGDNPLYLPQAKTYDACCGLGPVITFADAMPSVDKIEVDLAILRGDETVFSGRTSGGEMARTFDELIGYLGRSNSFPNGVFLMTGTGIVPDSDFSLAVGDEVRISITGIGTLVNRIASR